MGSEPPTGGSAGGALPSLDLSRISYAAMGGSADEIAPVPLDLPDYDSDTSEDMDGMMAAVEEAQARHEREAEARKAREEKERQERQERLQLEQEQQARIQSEMQRLHAESERLQAEQAAAAAAARARVEQERARAAELRAALAQARADQRDARAAELEEEERRAGAEVEAARAAAEEGNRRLGDELARVRARVGQIDAERGALEQRRAREAVAFSKFESDLKTQAEQEAAQLAELRARRQELLDRLSGLRLGLGGTPAAPGAAVGGGAPPPAPPTAPVGAGGEVDESRLSWKERQELRWKKKAQEVEEWERKQREWEEAQRAKKLQGGGEGGGGSTDSNAAPPAGGGELAGEVDESRLSWKERQELRWKKKAQEVEEWERKQREWEEAQRAKQQQQQQQGPGWAGEVGMTPAPAGGAGYDSQGPLSAPAATASSPARPPLPAATPPTPPAPPGPGRPSPVAAGPAAGVGPDPFALLRAGKPRHLDALAGMLGGDPALVHVRDPRTGATLLGAACRAGNRAAVEMLLQRGAAVNAPDPQGDTPLHVCFREGHLELGDFLLGAGADDSIENRAGQTPYDQ